MAKIKSHHILGPNWILISSFFASGLFLGGLAIYLWLGSVFPTIIRIHPSGLNYSYINPLLGVDTSSRSFFSNQALELKLQALINKSESNKLITSASIYFRDIDSGSWAGINENDKFSPGKLLKIPILMTYFKLAEQNPELLDKEVEVRQDELFKEKQIYTTKKPIQVGEKYTVNQLIEKMIVDYDNTATNVLFDNVDNNALDEVFSDLGITFKEDRVTQDFISLKSYSLFFRVLYNTTFLNRDFSERALKLLVSTPNTISLGLAQDTPIANLEGARTLTSSNNEKSYELYDCGIIYYGEHPYDLCAIVRGNDLNVAKDFLNKAGGIVVEEMKFKYEK